MARISRKRRSDRQAGADEIKRIYRPDKEQFAREFVARKEPVIITGMAETWKACSLWTVDYLISNVGNKLVTVHVSDSQVIKPDYNTAFDHMRKRMRFNTYVKRVLSKKKPSGKHYYMATVSVRNHMPELINDFDWSYFFGGCTEYIPFLWFGIAGIITPLHYDPFEAHNFHAQIRGSKRFVLYSSEQSDALYAFSPDSRIRQFSQIDIDVPDFKRFPKFKRAQRRECVLEAGEILFLPEHWWHQVYSLDLSISLNVWWRECWLISENT
jgi:Cupin-like domain